MNKFKKLKIRDFTLQLAKVLYEGGEVVIYKGDEPYRYMNIRKVKVIGTGVITDEEKSYRQKASQEGEKELLREDAHYE